MMKIKAQAKWLKIPPRKLGRVAEIIRGLKALEAMQLLQFMPQKGARILAKLLNSAIANAKNNFKLAEESLKVDQAFANQALTMKRWQPRARGRVNPKRKRTSHLTIWLIAENNDSEEKK